MVRLISEKVNLFNAEGEGFNSLNGAINIETLIELEKIVKVSIP